MAKYFKGKRQAKKQNPDQKFSIDQMITDKIMEQLQQGIIPWHKDWQGRPPISYGARAPYHGTNLLTLPAGGEYITGAQAKKDGFKIKEGVHGFKIIYWELKKYTDEDGQETSRPFARFTTVFPLHMIEDIQSKYPEGYRVQAENPEAIISKHSEKIPPASEYPAVFRQLVEYAFLNSLSNNADITLLELVREIGAGFLLSKCELPDSSITDRAAYCNYWLAILQQNPKMIMRAAGKAQKAADEIMGISS